MGLMTAAYSILHLLVDGVCALAMFGSFLLEEEGYFLMLIYNFCAFALQMPLGILLDMLELRKGKRGRGPDPALWAAVAGVLLTTAGALTHPAVLGMGNALFHVGGGVGCIREDNAGGWKGRGLGVFVAPGAMGLYLGTLSARYGAGEAWLLGSGVLMAVLCGGMICLGRRREEGSERREAAAGGLGTGSSRTALRTGQGYVFLASVCLLVVVLRSYVGMAVTFPWKTGVWTGFLAVLAIAGGKAAGGFAAARYGAMKTAAVSLALAAVCYLFSSVLPLGLAALFLFNMTMPVTLYWIMRGMPDMTGFAFGFLTFALFLGFLPRYFGLLPQAGGRILGCIGSVLSLLLLWTADRRRG